MGRHRLRTAVAGSLAVATLGALGLAGCGTDASSNGGSSGGKTTIQVVPYRAGAHAGAIGAFVVLDFPEATDPAVVYVETLAGDVYLEEGPDVTRYTIAFDRLVAAALHPDDSVQMIERLARTLK